MRRTAILFILNIAVMFMLMALLGLRLNVSNSYPLGVYKRTPGAYEKYTFVESCLPENVASFMIDREYIPNIGNCGGYPPVIKMVYATEGDKIEVDNAVSINERVIDNTVILQHDDLSRPLAAASDTTVNKDHVWLMSNSNPNSYDARYFGQTPVSLIRSRLEPLWIAK